MICIPEAFKPILDGERSQFLYYGGRVGGKTKNTANIAVLLMLQHPNTDVIVARASYGSMADSSYEEFEHAIKDMGDEYYNLFYFKRSPLRIERKDGSGKIYFLGYGGSNMSRTKSLSPKHPVICVVCEETQELREKRNLDEALASFRRHYANGCRQIIMGNPPPQESHWFNIFVTHCSLDTDWFVKRVTYMDILDFINDYDLREIIKTKINDPDYYNWFYCGSTYAGLSSVYPMFRESRHVITALEFDRLRAKHSIKVVACMIGADGAVNRDTTAFCPLMLISVDGKPNGQAVVGPLFIHNPKEDGVLGYHQLVQDHVSRWLEELCLRYGMGSPNELRRNPGAPGIPIYMRIDSAAPDLVQECKFFFGDRVDVRPVNKKGIMEMVGITQSAISNDNIVVLDYGGHMSYVKNLWVKDEKNKLVEQLQMLIWNDRQNGYDPIVPNDISDAFTYGTISWYGNQENIQYFNILKSHSVTNALIRDIIQSK